MSRPFRPDSVHTERPTTPADGGAGLGDGLDACSIVRRNLRALLFWPVLGLVLCLAMWATLYAMLETDTRAAQAKSLQDAASLSQAYAEYLNRTIGQADQLTLYVKRDWEKAQDGLRLEGYRETGMFTGKHTVPLSIFDRHGTPVTSTASFSRHQAVRDRSYFRFHKEHPSEDLLIGAPVAGRLTGKTIIPLTRRLNAPDGSFAGVVLAAIDPGFFFPTTSALLAGKAGLLVLATEDGAYRLTRTSTAGVQVNAAILPRLPPIPAPVRLDGNTWFGDGVTRYAASQQLDGYPLLAIAALSEHEALRLTEQAQRRYWQIAGGVSLLLVIFTCIATSFAFRLVFRKARLRAVSHTYRLATEVGNEGFYMWEAVRDNNGRITDFVAVDCNERGARLLGTQRDKLLNKKLSEVARPQSYMQMRMAHLCTAMEVGFHEAEVQVPADSNATADWFYCRTVRSGNGLAITLRDISEQKQHEQQLLQVANQDPLTGLPNHYWLSKHLPGALERAAGKGHQLAVLFLDVDDFKDVNNALGRSAGDRLLQEIGTRLLALRRPGDQVVRRAGAGFCMVRQSLAGREDAAEAAQHLMLALQDPFAGITRRKALTASTGIALFPDDGDTAEALLTRAEIAMYAAKAECKGKFRFYDPALYHGIQQRLELEQQLLRAISESQFVVYYQPRVHARSGELVGMEALVRWQHPERGIVPPNDFIPLAEANGLIIPLGESIMEQVCAQLASWQELDLPVVPVSVNVSAKQFDEGKVGEWVSRCLARYRIPPHLLELELTESAMMGDFEAVQREVSAINALGVKIHVDDFGTGYSSLSLLHKLNVDVLKVDRAFTSQLGHGQEGQIFFTAIISMAKELGMSVVAEGVETEQQLRVLQRLQCDEIQGYLVSKPLPAQQMPALMQSRILLHEGLR